MAWQFEFLKSKMADDRYLNFENMKITVSLTVQAVTTKFDRMMLRPTLNPIGTWKYDLFKS